MSAGGEDPARKRETTRRRVAEELLATERSYVESLTTIVSVFIAPLQAMLTDEECSTLFSNLQVIAGLNQRLWADMSKRLETWDVPAPPSSALPNFVSPVAVGDLFIEFAPMLKLYAQFASNNEASSRLVARLREDNEEFAEFADAASNDARCKGQSIESFLIMPIQRIPRYSLLLAELKKHTPEAHADFALLPKAEEVVAMVGKNINEAVRASENREQLMRIQHEIGNSYTLVAPHRVFIRRGQLTKKCRARDKTYEFLLFNDLLLYGYTSASGYLVINRELPIDSEFSVDDKPDLEDQFRFEIVNSVKSFIVYTNDRNVKFAWLIDLMHLTTELKQKQSEKKTLLIRASTRLNEAETATVSSIAKPVWQADNEATNCPLCRQGFSFLNRRHHCRKCGVLCCGDCSSARLPLIGSGSNERVRFCDRCAEESRRPAPPPPAAASTAASGAVKSPTSVAVDAQQRSAPSGFSAKLTSSLMGGRSSVVVTDATSRPWQPQRLRAPSGAAPAMPVGGVSMATTVASKPFALPGVRARGPSVTAQNATSVATATMASTASNQPHDVLVVSDSDSDEDNDEGLNGSGGGSGGHVSSDFATEDSNAGIAALTSADLVSVQSLSLFATNLRAATLGADAAATSDAASTLFCRAKFDFAGRSLTELSVRAQAALFVLRRDADIDAQWWECADTDGHRGLVPVSYLDTGIEPALALAVMSERVGARVAAEKAAAAAAAAAKSVSLASAADASAQVAELELVAAASAATAAAARLEAELPFEVMTKVDHSPATDSELGYVLADTLVVHSIDASGWWFGTNLRTKAVGWVAPDNVVRSIARRHTRGRSMVVSATMVAAVAGPNAAAKSAAAAASAATPQPKPGSAAPIAAAVNVAQLGSLRSVMETADEDSVDLTLPVGRCRSNVVAEVTCPTVASTASSPPPASFAAGSASAVRGGQRPSMPPAGAVAQQLRTFMSASAPAVTASASSSPATLKPSSAGTASASGVHEQSAPISVQAASTVKMAAPAAVISVQAASTVKMAAPAAVAASKAVAAAPAASTPASGGSACNVDACVCTEFAAHPFKPNLCRDCRHAQTSHSCA